MAKAESFRDLIGSIQEAFLAVNELSEQQHLEMLGKYFDEDDKPKTMQVKYPIFGDNGEITYKELEIPLLCLVPVSSLKINEIDIDFKVKLSGKVRLSQENRRKDFFDKADGLMQVSAPQEADDSLGFVPEYRKSKNGSYADISLKFKAEEAPEGLLRIRDELIKILP